MNYKRTGGSTPIPEPARRSWRLPLLTGIAGLLVGGAAGVGGFALYTSGAEAALEKTIFVTAVESCEADTSFADVADENRTLTLNHKGQEDPTGLSWDDLWCIADAIKTPAAVKSHMEQTTAVDGRQTETFGNVTVSWGYHPDQGMDSVWTLKAPTE